MTKKRYDHPVVMVRLYGRYASPKRMARENRKVMRKWDFFLIHHPSLTRTSVPIKRRTK